MTALIEHITRIVDPESGKIFEHCKREEIQIDAMTYQVKKYNFKFRYTATGRGDMAMGLKEIVIEKEKETVQ